MSTSVCAVDVGDDGLLRLLMVNRKMKGAGVCSTHPRRKSLLNGRLRE